MAVPAYPLYEALGDRAIGFNMGLKVSSNPVLTCQRTAYFNVTKKFVEHIWQRGRQYTTFGHSKDVPLLTT